MHAILWYHLLYKMILLKWRVQALTKIALTNHFIFTNLKDGHEHSIKENIKVFYSCTWICWVFFSSRQVNVFWWRWRLGPWILRWGDRQEEQESCDEEMSEEPPTPGDVLFTVKLLQYFWMIHAAQTKSRLEPGLESPIFL